VVAQVAQLCAVAEQSPRRLREENLPAVAGAHDARGAVHVGAHIPLVRDDRLTGVDADPHAHISVGECLLGVSRCGQRVGRARERDEKRVPLGVDFDPAVLHEGVAQQPSVLREDVRVALAELVQETGRALDVREEQRDRPARKCPHAGIIALRRPQAKSTMITLATAHRR
jgi:hypothetical protein